MKRSEQDRLLKEILAVEEPSDFRQASLDLALMSIRRKRQTRRIACTCVLSGLMVALASEIILNHRPKSSLQEVATSSLPGLTAFPPPADTVKVKFITDEELLALFPDRPVALIGRPGHQQLVFLDKPASTAASDREL
jgi:hypothetical protein